MAVSKRFIKTKAAYRVTFSVPATEVEASKKVTVLGDFNGWDVSQAALLKKQKDGSFKGSVELVGGQEYQFRYLLDGQKWINDKEADKYVPAGIADVMNCVVVL